MTATENQHRLKIRVINCDSHSQSLLDNLFSPFPLHNSKDQKTWPCALGTVFWQGRLHKGTFNSEPWHHSCMLPRGGSHHCPPQQSRESEMPYCPRVCHLGNNFKDNSGPGFWARPSHPVSVLTSLRKVPLLSRPMKLEASGTPYAKGSG